MFINQNQFKINKQIKNLRSPTYVQVSLYKYLLLFIDTITFELMVRLFNDNYSLSSNHNTNSFWWRWDSNTGPLFDEKDFIH